MAWIASSQGLGTDPRVWRLARRLGVSRAQVLGHLHLLWWWCLEHAPLGDVSGLEAEDLAEAAEWGGDAGRFAEVLVECGWLEGGKVAGWQERAGALMAHRRRQRLYRERVRGDGGRGDVTVTGQQYSNSTEERFISPSPSKGKGRKFRGRAVGAGELEADKYLRGKYAKFFAPSAGEGSEGDEEALSCGPPGGAGSGEAHGLRAVPEGARPSGAAPEASAAQAPPADPEARRGSVPRAPVSSEEPEPPAGAPSKAARRGASGQRLSLPGRPPARADPCFDGVSGRFSRPPAGPGGRWGLERAESLAPVVI